MPYKTKKVIKKIVKKPYKAPVKRSNVKEKVFSSLGKGFPKQMMMTHTYVQNDTLTTTSGTVDYQTYSCNNLFDPDYSGGGHQPLYFDQMSLLYHHYTVIGSKIEICYGNSTGGSIYGTSVFTPLNMTLHIHPSATPSIVDPILVSEQNNVKLNMLPAGDYCKRVSSKWSAKKFFGGSILGNDELKGTPSAGPVEQSYWTFAIKPVDAVSTCAVTVQVKITYIAIWRELKNVAQS